MAKHNRAYHTCDICGVEMDKPYRGGERGTYSLILEEDFAVAGNVTRFEELCQSCNDVARGWVHDFKALAREMRKARDGAQEGEG